jgi:hypothetical protein
MNKRIAAIAVIVIGLALYATHTADFLGLVRAIHGR